MKEPEQRQTKPLDTQRHANALFKGGLVWSWGCKRMCEQHLQLGACFVTGGRQSPSTMPQQQRSNAGWREHGVGEAGKEGWKQAACGLGCLEGLDRCSAVRAKEFGSEIRGKGTLWIIILFCYYFPFCFDLESHIAQAVLELPP